MSKFLDLDTQFSFITEMLTFLKSAKKQDEIFDRFLLSVTDLTHHIDRCVFATSRKFNQLYDDEVIDEKMLNCFRQVVNVEGEVSELSWEKRVILQKRYANMLNERVNAVKAMTSQTTLLEKLQRQYLALKKERQQLIPTVKGLFTLPTYLLGQFESKKQLSRIAEINLALFSIEEFYHALIDIVRP